MIERVNRLILVVGIVALIVGSSAPMLAFFDAWEETELRQKVKVMEVADQVRTAIGRHNMQPIARLTLDTPANVVAQLSAAGFLDEETTRYVRTHPERFMIHRGQFDARWLIESVYHGL